MNFSEEFKRGQSGGNKGLSFGKEFKCLDSVIGGIQRQKMYAIGGAPKTGKSTFVDYGFLIEPLLYAIERKIDIQYIYFSFEIDRLSKEFDFACFFLYRDYGIKEVSLPSGITYNKKNSIPLSSSYLRGRLLDDKGNIILIDKDILKKLRKIYINRLIPIFGEYNKKGEKIKEGYVDFITSRNNPTGLRNFLKKYAEDYGKFETKETNKRGFSSETIYIPKNPEKYTIIITDHIRLLKEERNFTKKQIVDKYLEYCTELKNICGFTFVHIIHLNRNLSQISNLKFHGNEIYPDAEDIKDTGNIAEEVDYLLTIFDPNDLKYKLKTHFDIELIENKKRCYPNLRTFHLVMNRYGENAHFGINMYGNTKSFEKLILRKKSIKKFNKNGK